VRPLRAAVRTRAVLAAVPVLAAVAVAGSGCALVPCSQFALSLVSDRGGQESPLAAARAFVDSGAGGGLPGSGWTEGDRDANGMSLHSGSATLHAMHGPDGTWQIDSGSTC
jgi:hypothetical protein